MKKLSDSHLIEKYLNGDEKALEFLVSRYLKPVYFFTLGFLEDEESAQDLTQEIFIKVWKNLKKFKKEKSFKTWIFVISKNSRGRKCQNFQAAKIQKIAKG